ncbi:MAG: hypothetical protein RR049_07695 [Angelakisella sp.]
MIEALNMQLEKVRTVLLNEVNEVSVCVDQKRESGVFYTMISITSPSVRLQVAGMLAADSSLATSSDFVGSFSHGDSLSLVFLYRQENLLSRSEAIYATDFARRKQLAEGLLVALAETQIIGSMGLLLLTDRNINISSDGSVYFNYFMDFDRWQPHTEEAQFYAEVSRHCFDILSREYQARYGSNLRDYPGELQVLAKKTQLRSFTSFNTILTLIQSIPDKPSEPSVGWRKAVNWVRGVVDLAQQNSMLIFMVGLILITVVYSVYQVTLRLSYRSVSAKNTTYIGMETIGEVYLGDETI